MPRQHRILTSTFPPAIILSTVADVRPRLLFGEDVNFSSVDSSSVTTPIVSSVSLPLSCMFSDKKRELGVGPAVSRKEES